MEWTSTDMTAWMGVILAAISLILTSINYVKQNYVKLKLTVRYDYPVPELGLRMNNVRLYWEVVNLSTFPVYLEELGFSSERQGTRKVKSSVMESLIELEPKRETHPQFPLKLESRQSVMFSVTGEPVIKVTCRLKYMYVETSCKYYLAEHVPYSPEGFTDPRTTV